MSIWSLHNSPTSVNEGKVTSRASNRSPLSPPVRSLFGGGALARSSARVRGGGGVGWTERRSWRPGGRRPEGYESALKLYFYNHERTQSLGKIDADLCVLGSETTKMLREAHS